MEETLINYISDNLAAGGSAVSLAPEDDLLNTGLVDSVGIMRLIGFIEQEFDLKIPPQDMVIDNFISVAAICSYVERTKAG